MKNLKYALFFLPVFVYVSLKKEEPVLSAFHFTGVAQGTTYHITYFAADSFVTHTQIDSIFYKIDSSLSIYKPYSLISRFNKAPDKIEMDAHLRIVVEKSLEIYKNTAGLSDITVYPIVSAWGFGPEHTGGNPPDSASIKNILSCVGSDKIVVDHNWLRKTKPCVKIDVNGIAQGYTVDVIADFLERNMIAIYLVEVGGELRVKGHKPPGDSLFKIGIERPAENSFDEPVIKKIIQIEKGAVTTSGNYRKYFESGGKIISHLMNPITGYPVQNELISVTVLAKDAMTADGYDNALMGMGLEKSFLFLQKHKEMEAYFIYHKADGSVGDTGSIR